MNLDGRSRCHSPPSEDPRFASSAVPSRDPLHFNLPNRLGNCSHAWALRLSAVVAARPRELLPSVQSRQVALCSVSCRRIKCRQPNGQQPSWFPAAWAMRVTFSWRLPATPASSSAVVQGRFRKCAWLGCTSALYCHWWVVVAGQIRCHPIRPTSARTPPSCLGATSQNWRTACDTSGSYDRLELIALVHDGE